MTIDFKTQTKRKTDFHRDVVNINLFVRDFNFEFGIVTSKYWGNFENRKIPLIEITIGRNKYIIPLDKFKEILKFDLSNFTTDNVGIVYEKGE